MHQRIVPAITTACANMQVGHTNSEQAPETCHADGTSYAYLQFVPLLRVVYLLRML